MEHFNGPLFLSEIEWLIPEKQVGSYYSGNRSSDGDGHNATTGSTKALPELVISQLVGTQNVGTVRTEAPIFSTQESK
jgi:hypothetical protein